MLLFVAIGGWLTWPSAEERVATRAESARWLAEGGFDGRRAVEHFNRSRALLALAGGLVVQPFVLNAPAAISLVITGAAVFAGVAAPAAMVEWRRRRS